MKHSTILVASFFGLMAAAPSVDIFGANACRSALKLTSNGVVMVCPSVLCPDEEECVENSNASDALYWCACGVGGTVSADCHATWTKKPNGTVASFACQDIDCDNECTEQDPPVVIGNSVYACKCS